jgi:uncharacterized membrane protein
MMVFEAVLLVATFLCSLVAGLLFAFAIVIMPGIHSLRDADFLRAFQAIDGVVQNNQPLFMLVWVGSAIAVLVAAVFGLWQVSGVDRALLIGAALVYLAGVQAPTVAINVPLNNVVKRLDIGALSETACRQARNDFELRWNRWNLVRTASASLATIMLMILTLRV